MDGKLLFKIFLVGSGCIWLGVCVSAFSSSISCLFCDLISGHWRFLACTHKFGHLDGSGMDGWMDKLGICSFFLVMT